MLPNKKVLSKFNGVKIDNRGFIYVLGMKLFRYNKGNQTFLIMKQHPGRRKHTVEIGVREFIQEIEKIVESNE